jgi:hypothetical protein
MSNTLDTELFINAIEKNNLQFVENYLNNGIDPNTVDDSYEKPAIFFATTVEMMKLLVEKGADINKKYSGITLLFDIIMNIGSLGKDLLKDYEILKFLLEKTEQNKESDDTISPFEMFLGYSETFLSSEQLNSPQFLILLKLFLHNGGKLSENFEIDFSKFNKTIQQLIQNSNVSAPKNFDFIPKIYVPLSHSIELTERILVPKNSIFISFNVCGLVTGRNEEGIVELFEDAKTKSKTKLKKFYGKPIENREKIQQILGRDKMYVKVSQTKDTLPNIEYNLIRSWNKPTSLQFLFSGIVPIEKFKDKNFHINIQEFELNEIDQDFFTNFLPSLFQFSVKPTEQEIKNAFGTLDNLKQTILNNPQVLPDNEQSRIDEFQKNPDLLTIDKILTSGIVVTWLHLAENINKFSIFKEKLYDLLEDFPGIYYHFMCRGNLNNQTTNEYKEQFFPLRQLSMVNEEYQKNIAKKHKINDNNKIIIIQNNNNLQKKLKPGKTYIFKRSNNKSRKINNNKINNNKINNNKINNNKINNNKINNNTKKINKNTKK